MKYLPLLILILFFSCEKTYKEVHSKTHLDAIEYIFDGVEFIINDYQISNNLIAFQIKIANNSENIVFIPRSVSRKDEMHNNILTIVEYYNYDHSEWKPAHDIYPEAFIIEPNETNYFSVFIQNNEIIKIIDFKDKDIKSERIMTFMDLIGTVSKIKITLGFYINHKENYLTDKYEEYDFFKIRNELKIITLEAVINDNYVVNNEIKYKHINK
jgi:hypothetical protein